MRSRRGKYPTNGYKEKEMVETLITFAAGVFIGSSLGVFLMALAVAAKREDEELEWNSKQDGRIVKVMP